MYFYSFRSFQAAGLTSPLSDKQSETKSTTGLLKVCVFSICNCTNINRTTPPPPIFFAADMARPGFLHPFHAEEEGCSAPPFLARTRARVARDDGGPERQAQILQRGQHGRPTCVCEDEHIE